MTTNARVIDRQGLAALIGLLRAQGHTVIGPTVRDEAIVLGEVRTVDDLPAGWTDEQDGGHYRLRRRDDQALFGHAVGPHAWKRYLFPPRSLMWRGSRRGEDGFAVDEAGGDDPPRWAFLGVRGCDLAAIAIQDRVFQGGYTDPTYAGRRDGAVVIAVHCGVPAGTCFCVSMGTGPRAGAGHDLALTELLEPEHRFVVEVGTERGAQLLDALDTRAATTDDLANADAVVDAAAEHMGRTMPTDGIHDLMTGQPDHPRWNDVAARCLACANCTMACPTCFCSTIEDTTDLTGEHAERWRTWDSCFTSDFTELGGSTVRPSTHSRYRQWMTHKLATWIDQFDTSGCVGCGRCITWCPVGIDITEEVRAIRESPAGTRTTS